MRDTIDFGIDLGTTNSALAVVTDGEVSVVKNNDQMDYTPSAVWMPRRGEVRVGQTARRRAQRDPHNAHAEFKLEMGLNDAKRSFAKAGVTLTPPQLSAEVLKSLRADASGRLGDTMPAAVITVPAVFRLHETNATSEAAKLAGFTSPCPLIQEPTAAAFAYGFQNESTDAYWMVFDFGGGTFDSAVVSTRDGELQVLDHAGDRHLGGKLIDLAIVDRLLVPEVVREFGFSDFNRDNPSWRGCFAELKGAAEEAKIALSRADRFEIMVDLFRDKEEVGTLEYSLSRGELDRIAEPLYVRAINLCRDALTKANLHTDDIDRLLLVGGATLAPGLREMLADPQSGLGIVLDVSQDPSTVVARGAAVYAGIVPLDRPFVAPSAGQFTVELDYSRTTSLMSVTVSGRFHSADPVDWSGYQVTLDNNSNDLKRFRTPSIAIRDDGTFSADVRLTQQQSTNSYTIELVDAQGARKNVSPDTIAIQHWLNEPAGQVLINSIGVAQASGELQPMITRGTRLAANETKMFQTTRQLRRSEPNSVIRIPIMEGERRRAARNLEVAVIEIRPHEVPVDLPKGSDVEVTITVDESRRVSAMANVPWVNEQFDAEVDLNNVPTPPIEALRYRLSEAETRLDRLRVSVRRSESERATELLAKLDAEEALETARGEVQRAGQDPGAAAGADEHIRDLMAELDEVEEAVALPASLDEIADTLADCQEMVGRLGDRSDRAELAGLERRLAAARQAQDAAAVDDLKGRAMELQIHLMKRDGNALDLGMYYALREMESNMDNPTRARALFREGEDAIAAQRWDALRGVNQRLVRLLPDDIDLPDGGGVNVRRGDER